MKRIIFFIVIISCFGCESNAYEQDQFEKSKAVVDSSSSRQTVIVYHADRVVIGSQTWSNSNLKATRYRNGDIIPVVENAQDWANLTTGACCYYQNNNGYNSVYGKLYNWHAVNDSRSLAPVGWRIPTQQDWNTLINYLGGPNVAGGKLKAIGFWTTPNAGATDISNFHALPAGRRFQDGLYHGMGGLGMWWTKTPSQLANNSIVYWLEWNTTNISTAADWQKTGYSVRLIRDL